MVSYSGRHAELYDLFYADKPYVAEAAFVHQCLRQYGGGRVHSILELACGTGSHAFELEKHGYKVVAIDYSEDMLACARKKASHLSSQVTFKRQDMCAIDLPEQPFDAAVCLFDSIGYARTNEALEGALRGVHQHLSPRGLFVFEFWFAGAMLRNYDPVRVRRWNFPEGEVLRISETHLDHVKQLAHVTYSVFSLNANGTYSGFTETHSNRYFLLQEMAGLLRATGFTPVDWFSGFTGSKEITEETWHVVAVAQRS